MDSKTVVKEAPVETLRDTEEMLRAPAAAPLVPMPLEVLIPEARQQTPAVGQRAQRPDCRLHGLGQTKYIDDALTLVQNVEAQRCEESVTGSVCEDVGLACSPPSGGSCRQVTNNAGNPAGCVCSALAARYSIVLEEPQPIVSEESQPEPFQEFSSIHQQPPFFKFTNLVMSIF